MIVLKLGGSALESALGELVKTVKGLRARGERIVIVHGGGPAINKELEKRGITWTFVNGQRRTTEAMIDVIDEVLSQTVNSQVVCALREAGLPAVARSGAAHSILMCTPESESLGLVGHVESVDTRAIFDALASDEIPVIAPIGRGLETASLADSCPRKYNINADWAATKIAVALRAEKLMFLTDQRGILDGQGHLVAQAAPVELEAMIASGVVSGGMCTKVLAMISALKHGVGQIRVLNALESSGSLENERLGTVLTESKVETYEYAAGFERQKRHARAPACSA